MRLSLIIPCYNEAANLPLLLDRCKGLNRSSGAEVILVDNGSTDGTGEVLRKLLPHYPACRTVRVDENNGYGFGIVSGMKASNGDILGWTHADMQADPQDALRGLCLFEKYGDDIFVKGRRYGRSYLDTAFTVGMSLFESLLLARPMWDINAQPTMFPRKFFESWLAPPNDFSLDLFAYYKARLYGLKVHRFPVRFAQRAHGVSHWNSDWTAKREFIYRTIRSSIQLKGKV
jgi:glycosyltransferase involved in cell wall biosynthesis